MEVYDCLYGFSSLFEVCFLFCLFYFCGFSVFQRNISSGCIIYCFIFLSFVLAFQGILQVFLVCVIFCWVSKLRKKHGE